MGQRIRRPHHAAGLVACLLALAAGGPAFSADRPAFKSGLGLDYLSRAITWDEGAGSSGFSAVLVTARQVVGFGSGLDLALSAGIALSDFDGLEFGRLPISLDYESGFATGLALGAEARATVLRSRTIEIQAVGRIVSSIGFSKTWPLEGFAVEGTAEGKPTWAQASVGPRLVLKSLGKFVPSVSVSADWLWGRFAMTETLGDLSGSQDQSVEGKSVIDIALGAEYEMSPRFTVEGRLGILPYSGGADAVVSFGVLYVFR
jgi:hypothetical protein